MEPSRSPPKFTLDDVMDIVDEVFYLPSDWLNLERFLFFEERVAAALLRMKLRKDTVMAMLDANAWNLDDSFEPQVMPDNYEAQLRIIEGRQMTSKAGNDMILVICDVVGQPEAKEVREFLMLPDPDKMNPKELNAAKNKMQKFFQCFKFDGGVFDPETDLPGLEGWAILSYQNDDTYGEQNGIRRYVIPKD